VKELRWFFRNMRTAFVGAILALEAAVDRVISAGLRPLDENINQSERNLWGIGLGTDYPDPQRRFGKWRSGK
jgi:hypothetical protein